MSAGMERWQPDSHDSSPERRGNERVKVDAFVKAHNTDREFVFKTRDLSPNGVFLYTPVAMSYPFSIGAELELELFISEQYATCRAVVERVVEAGSSEAEQFPTGFGVRIIDVDDDSRGRIRSIIDKSRLNVH